MPNILELELRRDKKRRAFREYWKKDTEYKRRKREENRAYILASTKRVGEIHKRKRNRLGLIPFFEACTLSGIGCGEMLRLIRQGAVPAPKKFRWWKCYSVEQVACLTQASFFAIIEREHYSFFCQKTFAAYIRQHWPDREEANDTTASP